MCRSLCRIELSVAALVFAFQGGGIPMNKFLAVLAVVSLAVTGCAGSRLLGTSPQSQAETYRGQSPDEYAQQPVPCSCDVCCDPCCGDGCGPEGFDCADGCESDGCGGLLGRGRSGGRSGACSSGNDLCRGCRALSRGLNPHAHGYPEMPAFTPGPQVGQTAYPYYTVRGPRDFLQNNPPTIGPY